MPAVRVRMWGTRGSIASSGQQTIRYGGNTACVSLVADDGTQLVLDCGTGSRELGLWLLGEAQPLPAIHLLVTHTHWDHIQGFPFFAPAYVPGASVTVYGSPGVERTLQSSLAGQMEHSYFPVHISDLRSSLSFQEIGEGRFQAGGVSVHSQYLNHTALTLGYRISAGGAGIVYATDHEPFWWRPERDDLSSLLAHPGDARHVEFVRDADLLIHDTQYTDAEYPAKRGWGHSTFEYVVDVACLAGVKRLALFHHDPARTDRALDALVRAARARARRHGASIEIFAAREGREIALHEQEISLRPAPESVPVASSLREPSVVLVSDDGAELTSISDALTGDRYQVQMVLGLGAAQGQVGHYRPDLVVVGMSDQPESAESGLDSLRAIAAEVTCPLVVLGGGGDDGRLSQIESIADDVVPRPWAPPMLRTRLRVWLNRAGREGGLPATETAPRRPSAEVPSLPATLPELFRGLPSHELTALLAPAETVRFRAGQVLFREGDAPGGVYYLSEGTVQLSLTGPRGDELTLGFALPGDTVGELAALDGGPRSATATAAEACVAYYLPREAFLDGVSRSPRASLRLLSLCAARLRQTGRALGEFAFGDVSGRIARRLLSLVRTHAVELSLTPAGLAELVGAEPDQALTVLGTLEARGLVRLHGDFVRVLDPEALLDHLGG